MRGDLPYLFSDGGGGLLLALQLLHLLLERGDLVLGFL
jgi:hypothetical protein